MHNKKIGTSLLSLCLMFPGVTTAFGTNSKALQTQNRSFTAERAVKTLFRFIVKTLLYDPAHFAPPPCSEYTMERIRLWYKDPTTITGGDTSYRSIPFDRYKWQFSPDQKEYMQRTGKYKCERTWGDIYGSLRFHDKEEDQLRFHKKVMEIVSLVDPSWSDYQKALFLHDYICRNCVADKEKGPFCHSPFGCLCEGKAVCEGIAQAYAILATMVGVPAVYVDSGNIGHHAWNMIKINGAWYHVDVTWDLCGMNHKYFLVNTCNINTLDRDGHHEIEQIGHSGNGGYITIGIIVRQ